jgi:hypothetical protein
MTEPRTTSVDDLGATLGLLLRQLARWLRGDGVVRLQERPGGALERYGWRRKR